VAVGEARDRGVKMVVQRIRDGLEDMAWQFAYRIMVDGRPAITAGGTSALVEAFDILGWDDPRQVGEEVCCEVDGCNQWVEAYLTWDGLYLRLCAAHAREADDGRPRPTIRQSALKREATRGTDGALGGG
jgi:hypothetical protein